MSSLEFNSISCWKMSKNSFMTKVNELTPMRKTKTQRMRSASDYGALSPKPTVDSVVNMKYIEVRMMSETGLV